MKASTKQTIITWLAALLVALLLSLDYDHALDKLLGEPAAAAEADTALIDYRYQYGAALDVSTIA